MKTAWIDAHCNLADPLIIDHLDEVYRQLTDAGCRALLLAGCAPSDWHLQQQMAAPGLVLCPSFGIHPWTVDAWDNEQLEAAFVLLLKLWPEGASLGEIGLDYARAKDPEARKKQIDWFHRQLESTPGHELPLILHIVRAHHDSLPLLKNRTYRGLVHSFWGPPQIAFSYIEKGFLISLPPRIQQADPHELLKKLPKASVVFESDSPKAFADGSFSTPLVLRDVFLHAATVWREDVDALIARQNASLTRLFPKYLDPSPASTAKDRP